MDSPDDHIAAVLAQHTRRLDRMYMKIKRYSVEQDVSSLKNSLSEAKVIYESMESEYHSALDCGLVDSDSSLTKTFNDATKAYLDSIKPAMKILKDSGMDTEVSAPVSLSDVHVSSAQSQFSVSSELANALTLPKISIPTFAGNPAEYKLFISLFDEAVAAKVNDSRSKLTYLSTFVKGEALQAIRPMLAEFSPESYDKARKALQERFGDPFLTTQVLLAALTQGKKVTGAHGLRQLSDELSEVLCVLGTDLKSSEADSQSFFLGVLTRCPAFVKNQWSKKALEIKKNEARYPCFNEFVNFMKTIANNASDPVYGMSHEQISHVKSNVIQADSRGGQSAVSSAQRACLLCAGDHVLASCPDFLAVDVSARYEMAKSCRVCFKCLRPGHVVRRCLSGVLCGVPGCSRSHHHLLHWSREGASSGQNPAASGRRDENQSAGEANPVRSAACNGARGAAVCLPVVPVMVNGICTNALLDCGSTHTLVAKDLVAKLNLKGQKTVCGLKTVSGPKEVTTKLVSLTVSPTEGTETLNLTDVLVVNDIPATIPPRDLDLSKYPHLADLPLPSHTGCLSVQLLLGMDHPELLVPLEVRAGVELKGEPYACRTKLGWALQGPLGSLKRISCNVNSVKCTNLDNRLKSLLALEREGDDEVAPSVQDMQVLNFRERETAFVDGHCVVPIPRGEGALNFPVNKVVAACKADSDDVRVEAEVSIREAQNDDVFCEEIAALSCGKQVKSSGHILSLDPVVDGDLLHVGGHLSCSSLPSGAKHQVILPSQHPVTACLLWVCLLCVLQQVHGDAHLGTNRAGSVVRRRFWEPILRCTVGVQVFQWGIWLWWWMAQVHAVSGLWAGSCMLKRLKVVWSGVLRCGSVVLSYIAPSPSLWHWSWLALWVPCL